MSTLLVRPRTAARPSSLLSAAFQTPLTSRVKRDLIDIAFMNLMKQRIDIRLNEDIDNDTAQLFIDEIQNYINDLRTKNKNKNKNIKIDIYHSQFPGGETPDFNAYNALLTNPHLSVANKIKIVNRLLPHLEINYGTHSPLITWVKWCMEHKSASSEDVILLTILMQNITDRRKKDKHGKEALDYVAVEFRNNKDNIPDHINTIYTTLVGNQSNPTVYFNSGEDRKAYLTDPKNGIPITLTRGGRKSRSAKPAAKQAKPTAKQAKPLAVQRSSK